MTDHSARLARLKKAGDEYQQARNEAERILAGPRDRLAAEARAAYAENIRKAAILRGMGHVWSDTWLDKILKEEPAKTDGPQ
ncbi:hypothetical protein [Micromonospora pisi]|nr:hypothetical protein [Micromonospora pisi]